MEEILNPQYQPLSLLDVVDQGAVVKFNDDKTVSPPTHVYTLHKLITCIDNTFYGRNRDSNQTARNKKLSTYPKHDIKHMAVTWRN